MKKDSFVYNIVLKSNKKQVMATARTLKAAKQLLADIKRIDKKLNLTALEYAIQKGVY